MTIYEWISRHVFHHVPYKQQILSLYDSINSVEEEHFQEIIDLQERVASLERAVDHLRLELKMKH